MSRRESSEKAWTAVNSAGHAAPAALAVDVVVLTVLGEGGLRVLVLERPGGAPALPGGFVGSTESPLQTAARKLREKTELSRLHIEQLATFAALGRDPRGWIPTVAHLALVPSSTEPADPAARWVDAAAHPPLAFDHDEILSTAIDRVRGKLWWSNVAVGILPGAFTLGEARHVYEAVAGAVYDPATFARDLRATGLIVRTGGTRTDTGGRPAALYRFAEQSPAWGAGRRKRVRFDEG
jgi:8-oxo-dGTP diphosphatase